ncbi:MAG: hypothetical protein ACON4R_14770 [Akkermansiaceae bacterium]
MTRSRYIVATILRNFGLVRKTKRLTDAAYEMHLMQDGEEILGALCWPKTEAIDDLSLHYWNLRRLGKEKEEIIERLQEAEEILTKAQKQKTDVLVSSNERKSPFAEKKEEYAITLKQLIAEHDSLMNKALATRRRHSAFKMKLQVMKNEPGGNDTAIKECLQNLASLRKTFMEEKEALEEAKGRIAKIRGELGKLEKGTGSTIKRSEARISEAYSRISQANKDITKHRAKLSALQEEQAALYRVVGHFLSLNANRKDCRKACRKHRDILRQVQLLLASIKWNQRLVGR